MLTMPFIQAATGLLIPLSVLMILFVKVPTAIALVSFIPVAPTLMLLAVEVVGLNEFGRIYKEKVRFRDYVEARARSRAVPGLPRRSSRPSGGPPRQGAERLGEDGAHGPAPERRAARRGRRLRVGVDRVRGRDVFVFVFVFRA
ncbi:hypothetical protein [Curtobacterium sp. 24E2]|nr:hypothetical protein JN350_08160 [Curtobacterium sp. 24E2]